MKENILLNKNMPKLTIITATFNLIKDNRIDFFKQSLESAHNQTYENIEHIVIDGASTDGTIEVLKEYKKKGWIDYYSEPDTGMWNAMNKGIKKATGDFIVFLNSDDYYANNNIIEICMKQIVKENADYSFANQCVVQRYSNDVILKAQAMPLELFFIAPTFHHETFICKKSVYEDLNYYNEKYKTAIDYDFNIKLALSDYKYTHINYTMIVIRIGGATSTIDGRPSEQTLANVATLFIDCFGSFYDLDYNMCCNMLCNHIYPPNFLRLLEEYVILKKLKNFNYSFFIDYINRLEYSTSMITTRVKSTKKTYKFFDFLPLMTVKIKNNKTYYKLFGIIPIFVAKVK